MFCLAAGMRIVARDTISPFFHINMEKVQIVFTIPEVGQGIGELILGDLLVVAAETKIIILRAVLLVKLLGIITHQNTAVLGSMHLVTGHAIAGLDRAVFIMAASDIIAQLVMTGKAQFGRGVFQQSLLVGGVSSVALRALSLINRRMLVSRCLNIIVHGRAQFLVTTGTKRAAFLV